MKIISSVLLFIRSILMESLPQGHCPDFIAVMSPVRYRITGDAFFLSVVRTNSPSLSWGNTLPVSGLMISGKTYSSKICNPA